MTDDRLRESVQRVHDRVAGIQVSAPFDVSAERQMYMLDLWALAPATTIDYADGDPVTVPAGPLAGKIAELHARASKPLVICRISTGALRLTDPDARKFPGYEATPPDRPTAPAADSVIGWSTGTADERFLDIRAASRSTWVSIMWKRFDLAVQLGCDGIEPDRNDVAVSDPGWTMTPDDQRTWFEEVARQAHQRELSVGMVNGTTIPGQVDSLADNFDWMLVERCGEYDDCDTTRPFINLQKAVFAIDYQTDIDGNPLSMTSACMHHQLAMINEGLIKDTALSSAYRAQCVP